MKLNYKAVTFLAILLTLSNSLNASVSLTLEGPELTSDVSGSPFKEAGIQILAKENVILDSFFFQNRGFASNIWLQNGNREILQTYEYTGGDNSHQVNVSWELAKDVIYFLVAEQANGKFSNFREFPVSNEHIQIDGRILKGDLDDRQWFNFNNLSTTSIDPPVEAPIPGALWLFGSGLLALTGIRKVKI